MEGWELRVCIPLIEEWKADLDLYVFCIPDAGRVWVDASKLL